MQVESWADEKSRDFCRKRNAAETQEERCKYELLRSIVVALDPIYFFAMIMVYVAVAVGFLALVTAYPLVGIPFSLTIAAGWFLRGVWKRCRDLE